MFEMSPSGLPSCPRPTDPAVRPRHIFSGCTSGPSTQENPNVSVNTTQHTNSSDRAPSHSGGQDCRWSTNDIRALIRIFETYAGPFAVGTVAELLGRASHTEVGKWIILHRQSAHALSVSEAKRATGARRRPRIPPPYCLPIACPLGSGITSIIGGIDDFELRVYLDGSLMSSSGLQLPETEE
ncbi:hypothetical protein LY76DRAFT_376353 [Colletotrichum caudatum]|nr:hypothetical protein LY76DRAFT_376353 [Colletotrichum caudatum]